MNPAHLRPLRTCLLALAVAASALATPARAAGEVLPPWGRGESQAPDVDVFYTLFGPGDDVASWWGHAALGVEDARTGESRLYNYGNFSFDEKMLARYAMGRLEFWVADAPVQPYLRFYTRMDREVRVLHLNLAPEAKLRMANHLAQNVLPANRDYLYDHYRDNCSTRLRDAVDVGLDGRFKTFLAAPGRMTLREHTRRYTAVNPAMSVLLDFAMNDTIDQPITRWDEAFLPDELERAMREFQVDDGQGGKAPLVQRLDEVHTPRDRAPTPVEPPSYLPALLLLGGGWGGLALLWSRRWGRGSAAARRLLGLQTLLSGLVLGALGTLMLVMWLFTDHVVVYRNENLFLANPLWFGGLWLGASLLRGKNPRTPERLRRFGVLLAGVALLGLVLKAFPAFDQNNWNILAFLLPVVLGHAAAWARGALRVTLPERAASVI